MATTRGEITKQAEKWTGIKEGTSEHRAIVDIYNSFLPHPRGYTLTVNDSWCAAFVSACAIKTYNTDVIPVECSCKYMIDGFMSLGEWVEDDAYVAQAGDVIFYDWGDSGSGDNTGWPDHVGIVDHVLNGYMVVIEGNKNNEVGRRTIAINSKYIRGFGVPKYSSGVKTVTDDIVTDVINGKYGNGFARKQALEKAGYSYSEVQAAVNARLSAGASKAVYYTIVSGDTLSTIAKKYNTTVSAIQKLNPKTITDVNKIYPGRRIRVK